MYCNLIELVRGESYNKIAERANDTVPAGFHRASVVFAGSIMPDISVSAGQVRNVPNPVELYLRVSLRSMFKYGSLT